MKGLGQSFLRFLFWQKILILSTAFSSQKGIVALSTTTLVMSQPMPSALAAPHLLLLEKGDDAVNAIVPDNEERQRETNNPNNLKIEFVAIGEEDFIYCSGAFVFENGLIYTNRHCLNDTYVCSLDLFSKGTKTWLIKQRVLENVAISAASPKQLAQFGFKDFNYEFRNAEQGVYGSALDFAILPGSSCNSENFIQPSIERIQDKDGYFSVSYPRWNSRLVLYKKALYLADYLIPREREYWQKKAAYYQKKLEAAKGEGNQEKIAKYTNKLANATKAYQQYELFTPEDLEAFKEYYKL